MSYFILILITYDSLTWYTTYVVGTNVIFMFSRQTPPDRQTPPGLDTPMAGRHPPIAGRHPPGRQTPPGQADTPVGRHPIPRWLLQRTIRILLECILVPIVFMMFVDFTNWLQDYIEEQLVSNTSRIPGVHV